MYDAFQRKSRNKTQYPIFVVTGFYGVGKTTFGAMVVPEAAERAARNGKIELSEVLQRRVHLFVNLMGEDAYCDADLMLERSQYREGPIVMRLIAKGIYGCSVSTFRRDHDQQARVKYDLDKVLQMIAQAQRNLHRWQDDATVTVVVQLDEFQVACVG